MRIVVRRPSFSLLFHERCAGLPTDPIQIDSISVTPDPPQPGKDLTVKVKATAVENIVVSYAATIYFSQCLPSKLRKELMRMSL
jgi:hypothetical protein